MNSLIINLITQRIQTHLYRLDASTARNSALLALADLQEYVRLLESLLARSITEESGDSE